MKKNHFFQRRFKSSLSKTKAVVANAEPLPSNFPPIFEFKELGKNESRKIDNLLSEGGEQAVLTQECLTSDTREVKQLTAEIKSINRQQVILVGERLSRVREILKHYHERIFEEWLKLTFGSPRTPYNILAYYRLYEQLPASLKPKIKEIPLKAAYVLASKEGELERKQQLVQAYKGEKAKEMLLVIRNAFPNKIGDKRTSKSPNHTVLDGMEKGLLALLKNRDLLVGEDRKRMKEFLETIETLL